MVVRLRLAWHVLRGYPLAYRLNLTDVLPLDLSRTENLWMKEVIICQESDLIQTIEGWLKELITDA